MRTRRKFSTADQVAIVARATKDGRIHCSGCGIWCKRRRDFEIDHILAEAMRPAADLKHPLKRADGQILCTACHKKKTRRDKANIAGAKRMEAAELSIVRPGKRKIWWRPAKEQKPPLRVAAGVQGIWRRVSG